jgi:hypothetical protein
MRDMIPVAEHQQLRRDLASGAVVDVDSTGYKNYIKIKNNRQQQQERIGNMEHRINNMEADIADIKSLLYRLLEK